MAMVAQKQLRGDAPGEGKEPCVVNIALHSPGIWSMSEAKGFLSYALPRLQLQLSVIFFLTQCLHALFKRLYLPRLVSEIMAGVILGPTILGRISPSAMETLFPEDGEVFISGLSAIGFMFFMFLIGVKMDPGKVSKAGIRAWIIGIIAVMVPLFCNTTITQSLNTLPSYRMPTVMSVTGILTLTSFPVIASLLIDLKIMNSELGRLALAATLISDLMSTGIGLGMANIRVAWAGWATSTAIKPYALSIFIVSLILSTRPVLCWIVQQTPEGKPVKRAYITSIAFMVMLAAANGDNVGLSYQLCPFLFGLCVPEGPPLGSSLVEKLETLIAGIFVPLLMAYCGMKIDLFVIYDLQFMSLLWAIVLISLGIKFLSIFLPALLCQVPMRDAATLALIMSAQGIVQLAVYMSVFINQSIDRESLSVLTVSVMLVASLTWVLVRIIYDNSRMYTGYQKRTIIHTPANTELRVLICTYRPDDAMASIKLLENSRPNKENLIVVYGLHLMELAGRASPLLINHQLGQKSSVGSSRSQKIIEVLVQFQKQFQDLVTVLAFTAISLMKFMHHDICSLAFDKSVSLIILPFHRKWNHLGKVVFDSTALRMVNQQVLQMAPCSVAILIDRSKIRLPTPELPAANSPYHVAVIFLGGDDDREAMAYGKRMANSTEGVQLTVFRLVSWEDTIVNHWDTILDIEVLKEMRLLSSTQDNIEYREERVRDGPETALIVNEMKEEYNLIIVGRHHREDSPMLTGLTEWNELPELGPIGDILALEEIKRPVSVMVVQQQLVKGK